MGSNERGVIVSGGLTGSLTIIGFGFRLAFPDMIVPFGWALALLCAGLIGLISMIVFGIRLYLWRRRRGDVNDGAGPEVSGYSQSHSGSGDNTMNF